MECEGLKKDEIEIQGKGELDFFFGIMFGDACKCDGHIVLFANDSSVSPFVKMLTV